MAIKNDKLGGTDWIAAESMDAADLNDTFDATIVNLGYLGEVRMFALSIAGAITKASLQGNGWAICDGTTPATQGISAPDITAATPNLENKFIRGSDDESSDNAGGSDTHSHDTLAHVETSSLSEWASGAAFGYLDHTISTDSNIPAYYELVFFIKVKN